MKKISFVLCIAILLALPSHAWAQTNFQPGFIVKATGDTLHGQVAYPKGKINPNRILFREASKNDAASYSPIEVTRIGIGGEIKYRGGIVSTESSPRATHALEDHKALQLTTDTVFLEVLVEGPKSLLSATNNYGNENFYILKGQTLELLAYKKYIDRSGDTTFTAETRNFVEQLETYLEDCPLAGVDLKALSHQKAELVALFETWYECQKELPIYLAPPVKMKIKGGLFTGATISTMDFGGVDIFNYLSDAPKDYSITPAIGLYLSFGEGGYLSRWAFRNELSWTRMDLMLHHIAPVNRSIEDTSHTRIAYDYLRLAHILRRNFRKGNANFFFNFGVMSGIVLRGEHSRERIRTASGVTNRSERPVFEEPRKMEISLLLGAGVNLHRYGLELRIENGNGMSSAIALRSSTRRAHLLFSVGL